jgi:formylglycine-generating enzyme required for sulfatase activity
MVWVPGGEFQMGGQDDLAKSKPDELPVHSVALDGFYMDATEVTNAEFSRFVATTGYKTYAELHHSREEYKGQVPDISAIPEENLKPASICFNPAFDASEIDTSDPLWPYHVWKLVQGADWRHPHGPDSNIEGKRDHPVVHVNYQDVMEYCKWAGKRLPTEAEWEYAARGGKEGLSYSWGNERNPDGPGKWRINIWQGTFPIERKIEDGHKHSAPVISDQFPPNDYGLYHLLGNVWEWTSDYYRPDYYAHSPKRNPRGPSESFDPQEPQFVKRVQRGGSFMCNENYCLGYRVSSRMKGDEISGSFHCGFRCVVGWNELDKYQNAPRQKQK